MISKFVTIEQVESEGINHDKDWSHLAVNINHLYDEWWSYPKVMSAVEAYSRPEGMLSKWCEENLRGRYCRYGRTFWFELPSDAVMFRMTWS
jgi:hypothetical protein